MSVEFLFLVLVPSGAFALAAALAFWFGRLKSRLGLGVLAAVLLAFTLAMIFGLQAQTGWDAFIYLFALMGLCVPAGLGGLIGGVVGWLRKDETLHA